MKYNIKIIVLENCNYSKKALKLLDKYKIKYNAVYVNYENKDKFKTDNIDTFPQIYLTKENSNGNLLLGGYDNIKSFIKNFKHTKHLDENKELFIKNNPNWSNKATLRLIELIH